MKTNNEKKEKIKSVLYPVLFIVILVIVWHFAVILLDVADYILPDPFDIPANLAKNFSLLMGHTMITLYETFMGLALSIIFALIFSFLIVSSDTMDKIVTPFIVLSQSFPKTAIAPLMVIWFGYDTMPKIVMSFLIGFFPITMNMVMGLRSPSENMMDLIKSFSATKSQVFRKIRIPASIPYFFNGIKISIPMCLVGAVVGEFVGANKGLGYTILMANNEFNTILAFSCLVVLSAAGALLYFVAQKLEKLAAPWYRHT